MATKKYVWFDSLNNRYVGNFTKQDLKGLKKKGLFYMPFRGK
tara:strand:- start:3138 stop:3263 length:126 start_codon:yes stop_codon:yes gene_type:complete